MEPHDDEAMVPDASTEVPDEATRRRPEHAAGPELKAGDQAWTLCHAGLAPIMNDLRDRLYDEAMIRRSVRLEDCRTVCFMALHSNYRLSNAEVGLILWSADPDEVVAAAMEVLFPQKVRRTWTDWARSALIANGLVPEEIGPRDLPHVLQQLEYRGACMPAEDFTEAGEAVTFRANLRQKAREQAQAQANP